MQKLWNKEQNLAFVLLHYSIYQTCWAKAIRCLAKSCILPFSSTCLMNSIMYEHWCKILYLFHNSKYNIDRSVKWLNWQGYLSPVKRICVFEHSVMTNFNCACPVIQRGHGSGFLSEGSSWFTACMSEQRRFWRDCADAQACLKPSLLA